jgi:hypothetical protein
MVIPNPDPAISFPLMKLKYIWGIVSMALAMTLTVRFIGIPAEIL